MYIDIECRTKLSNWSGPFSLVVVCSLCDPRVLGLIPGWCAQPNLNGFFSLYYNINMAVPRKGHSHRKQPPMALNKVKMTWKDITDQHSRKNRMKKTKNCNRNTITKTCLYNVDPLKPHFYIVKLGFTGVYIIFLISAQKHRLWVLIRTASPRGF